MKIKPKYKFKDETKTVSEWCDVLDIDKNTAYRWMNDGRLPRKNVKVKKYNYKSKTGRKQKTNKVLILKKGVEYSIKDAMELMEVSLPTVYKMIRAGVLERVQKLVKRCI